VVLASAALGSSQAALDDPRAGRKTVEEALRIAERSGRSEDIVGAYLHLAELLTGPLNELETGIQVARNGAARAEALGLGRTYGTRLRAAAANGLFRVGRWAEGEQVITEAFARRPSGAEAAELLLARCRLYTGYGDLDAAERDLDAVDTLVAGAGGARYQLPLLTLRAGLAMWRGDHAAARRAVQEGLELFENGSDDLTVLATLVWHGLRAEAEARAGWRVPVDEDAVRALCQAVERLTKTRGTSAGPAPDTVTGYLALCAGELSRIEGGADRGAWARAAQVWSRAAQAWEQRQHPYPAAYARLRQADAGYAWRARNAEAKAALQAAYQAAFLLRARPLMKEMDELARRARVKLHEPIAEAAVPERPALPCGGPAGELARLTQRELEVLDLVAEGLTNQQIHSRVQATAIFLRNRPD
jgi:tetratricopeptide (TPR) repeat protein